MRNLSEIIDAAKEGRETPEVELLYALLAYSALHYFDHHALQRLAHEPSKLSNPQREYEEAFRRFKMALNKSPKEFMGWNNDPANPDCRRRYALGKRLIDKLAGEGTAAQEGDNRG